MGIAARYGDEASGLRIIAFGIVLYQEGIEVFGHHLNDTAGLDVHLELAVKLAITIAQHIQTIAQV